MAKRILTALIAIMLLTGLFSCKSKLNSDTIVNSDVQVSGTGKKPAQIGLGTDSDDTEKQGADILVAYFSATGNTESVAKTLAEALNADLYEIVPKKKYKKADLDYNDEKSRSYTESHDKNARPEIGSPDIDLSGYSVICIGYPIWFGDAPKIMSTFAEKYDFGDVTVIPFCTSGSSGIEKSVKTLKKQSKGGIWRDGMRFDSDVTAEKVQEWAKSLFAR